MTALVLTGDADPLRPPAAPASPPPVVEHVTAFRADPAPTDQQEHP